MNAWATVGSVWPTLSVPGITRSGTSFNQRNMAVVVANDPIPSVSKKFVTAPTATCAPLGPRVSVAADGVAGRSRPTPMTARVQPPTNTAVSAPSAVNSPVIGFIVCRVSWSGRSRTPSMAGGDSLQQLLAGAGFPLAGAFDRLADLLHEIVGQARLGDESVAAGQLRLL